MAEPKTPTPADAEETPRDRHGLPPVREELAGLSPSVAKYGKGRTPAQGGSPEVPAPPNPEPAPPIGQPPSLPRYVRPPAPGEPEEAAAEAASHDTPPPSQPSSRPPEPLPAPSPLGESSVRGSSGSQLGSGGVLQSEGELSSRDDQGQSGPGPGQGRSLRSSLPRGTSGPHLPERHHAGERGALEGAVKGVRWVRLLALGGSAGILLVAGLVGIIIFAAALSFLPGGGDVAIGEPGPGLGEEAIVDPGTYQELAQRILNHPRISFQQRGCADADIRNGSVDINLLRLVLAIADAGHTQALNVMKLCHKPGSDHEQGWAVDIGSRGSSSLSTMAGFIYLNRATLKVKDLFGPDQTYWLDEGNHWSLPHPPGLVADHLDHIHVSVFPGGKP